jgi:hypothetical protein
MTLKRGLPITSTNFSNGWFQILCWLYHPLFCLVDRSTPHSIGINSPPAVPMVGEVLISNSPSDQLLASLQWSLRPNNKPEQLSIYEFSNNIHLPLRTPSEIAERGTSVKKKYAGTAGRNSSNCNFTRVTNMICTKSYRCSYSKQNYILNLSNP